VDNKKYAATGGKDIIGRSERLTRLQRVAPTKANPAGICRPDGKPVKVSDEQAARVNASIGTSGDAALDRYDTQGGKLYRRVGEDFELIRDFTDMSFERIRAPYDWRDVENDADPAPWHPLDSEQKR